jgi:hypothetical protein
LHLSGRSEQGREGALGFWLGVFLFVRFCGTVATQGTDIALGLKRAAGHGMTGDSKPAGSFAIQREGVVEIACRCQRPGPQCGMGWGFVPCSASVAGDLSKIFSVSRGMVGDVPKCAFVWVVEATLSQHC